MQPHDDFCSMSVYPTQLELRGAQISLRKNIVTGKFPNARQYLDIQFRLLREDFVSSVREGIANYQSNKATKRLRIYENVKVIRSFQLSKIRINCVDNNPADDEDSKQFMDGSLLLFTKNNFTDVTLARVIRKENNEIIFDFIDNNELSGECTMAECEVYFEPYFHVLGALQSLASVEFPMEKYIIKVDTSAKYLPRYLLKSLSHQINGSNFSSKKWPMFCGRSEELNEAQSEAFKAALTQEFVVIQGPPGTGKTYLGIKIVETLIDNHHLWYNKSPILVITYKNYALDLFLESLMNVTKRIVRIGGQSKSEKLKEFNLKNLRKSPEFSKMNDTDIMKKFLIVGMTTTSAARFRDKLEELKSPIVLVEEAAEVLEAHVVAALTQHCQHLILLGDHQQLQPCTADYTIGTKYHLGLSLFERMVNNGIQCHKLNIQHRMRPEISYLLTATIYPFLENDRSVCCKPPIVGVKKNLFFIDHRQPEATVNITSKKNEHEAKFLIAFAKYLILNGHNDVTIIATYSGQVQTMKTESENLKNVKISTLDAFQGQESEIVLLSLVRSDDIGFLSIENRICVALSRAKNGLYMMGNMGLLSKKSKIWNVIKKCLRRNNSVGEFLVLECQNHRKRWTFVKNPEDFGKVALGGCDLACSVILTCGHQCPLSCHTVNRHHENIKCGICGRFSKYVDKIKNDDSAITNWNYQCQNQPSILSRFMTAVTDIAQDIFDFISYFIGEMLDFRRQNPQLQ